MKVQTKKDGYERLRPEKVYYSLGETNVHRSQSEAATSAFTRVVESKDSTANEKADAHLWMGKIYDSRNERPKALHTSR